MLESSPLYLKGMETSNSVCGERMNFSVRIELSSDVFGKESIVLKFPVNFVFAQDTGIIKLTWKDEDSNELVLSR